MVDVIILGAGTAGLSAAIYGVRAGLSVLVLENSVYGGQIINSLDVDNYPGFLSISGFDFAQKLYEQATTLGAQVQNGEITALNLTDNPKRVETTAGIFEAKTVILATGASHRKLGCPGEERLSGRGVSYCATCDGAFFRGKDVCVVGGGNTALEDALFLSNVCRSVGIIHRRDTFRADQAAVDAVKQRGNIEFLYSQTVSEICGEDRVEHLLLQQQDGSTILRRTDGIFIAVGMIPNSTLFAEQVAIDREGYVIAGENCRTNLPGVFAAGDLRQKELRQLVTAAADGAVAAVQAAKFLQ